MQSVGLGVRVLAFAFKGSEQAVLIFPYRPNVLVA